MKIFVAGHMGMVGQALCRKLKKIDDVTLIVAGRSRLDLLDQQQVMEFLQEEKPDQVYIAGAKVGGIYANNTYPAQFIYENLQIQTNLINAAHESGVQKLLFLGSSCIYPKYSNQPIEETELLGGALEPTNEPYAIAKIAGIKMCESYNRQFGRDYRSVMPTNLYGPGDNYHPEHSHVIPGLIRKLESARQAGNTTATIWGSGTVFREFLHVDDMADACIFIQNIEPGRYSNVVQQRCSHINVGSGEDLMISELAEKIKQVVGFKGELVYDLDKPDGPPRKLLDISKLDRLGWKPKIDLLSGLQNAYETYLRDHTIDHS